MAETVGSDQSFHVTPFPEAKSQYHFFQAKAMEQTAIAFREDPEMLALKLTEHIFDHHPDELDLPPHVNHRYREAKKIVEAAGYEEDTLTNAIITHFEEAKNRCTQGFVFATAASFESEQWNASSAVRVYLPPTVQERLLVLNDWVVNEIKNGRPDQLFGTPPFWTVAKLADGSWLPVGNLMVEVTQGVARIRTPFHDEHDLIERWNFSHPTLNDYVDLNRWVVMTHIVDKELLHFLNMLGKQKNVDLISSLKLNTSVYVKSYEEIVALIDRNHDLHIPGVLSSDTWIYDPQLKEKFPNQAVAHLRDVAGDVVVIASAEEMNLPIQIMFATGDTPRRKAFENGTYIPMVTARFITNDEMKRLLKEYTV